MIFLFSMSASLTNTRSAISRDIFSRSANLRGASTNSIRRGKSWRIAAAAMRHAFPRRIEFVDAPRKFAEREKMSLEIADLVFVRLADIENKKIISAIEPGLEFARSNFWNLHGGAGSFFAAHAAEFVVIDQLGDGAMRTAHWAIWIFAQLEFAEFHSESVKQQQAPHETIAAAKNQLDRFHCLDGADDSGQNAEDAAFRAGRDKPGRGRFRIEAAVARAIPYAGNSGLFFATGKSTAKAL